MGSSCIKQFSGISQNGLGAQEYAENLECRNGTLGWVWFVHHRLSRQLGGCLSLSPVCYLQANTFLEEIPSLCLFMAV